jgi:hypothetical protein
VEITVLAALSGIFSQRVLEAVLAEIAGRQKRGIYAPMVVNWIVLTIGVSIFVLLSDGAVILIAPAFALALLIDRLDGYLLTRSDESIRNIVRRR